MGDGVGRMSTAHDDCGHPLEGMAGDWVYMPSEGAHASPIVQLYGPWPGEGWREMSFMESVQAHARAELENGGAV